MMKFSLSAKCKEYEKTLFDIMRIFIPDFQWESAGEGVKRIHVQQGSPVSLLCIDNQQYTVNTTEDMDSNQYKRAIKAALYSALEQELSIQGNQWGIMTGMRPTKIVHRMWDQGLSSEKIKKRLTQDYRIMAQKADLLIETTQRQRKILLSPQQAKQWVSVYISIPFCPSRCSYCSFPSFGIAKPAVLETYLTYLMQEITAVGTQIRCLGQKIQTVYIGGGTPTTLSAQQLERLLSLVYKVMIEKEQLVEFTIEAGRADTIDLEKLKIMKRWGVNRISINPQTFWEPTLAQIGRKHTVQEVLDVFYMAKNLGFETINMDLIVGLPQEGLEQFQHTLSVLHQLQPENFTIHTLAIKRTAILAKESWIKQQPLIIDEMMNYLQQWLSMHRAYQPYYLYRQKQMVGNHENVGYSLNDHDSIYNIQMMEERQTIHGLGVGSASKYVNSDDWTLQQTLNPKDLFYYQERLEEIIARKVDKIATLS